MYLVKSYLKIVDKQFSTSVQYGERVKGAHLSFSKFLPCHLSITTFATLKILTIDRTSRYQMSRQVNKHVGTNESRRSKVYFPNTMKLMR